MIDVRKMNKSKSDQLNAVDIGTGTMLATITGAKEVSDPKQPLFLYIDSWGQPWKPCLTMRRVMNDMWREHDAQKWVGRTVLLYNDPTVDYGGEATGGVRIKEASHLDETFTGIYPKSRGKRGRITVEPLKIAKPYTIDDLCAEHGITVEAIDAWLANVGKPPLSEVAEPKRNAMAAWLNGDRSRIATVRDFMDADLGRTNGGEE